MSPAHRWARAAGPLERAALGCALVAAALTSGCGARSDLSVEDPPRADGAMDAATHAPDAAAIDGGRDAGIDGAGMDAGAPPDATPTPDAFVPPDAPMPECSADADCDDGLACTEDACEGGRCLPSTPVDARCSDGLFCNGDERCAAGVGCVPGAPPCDDGVACTSDACVEPARRCDHQPSPALCPDTRDCDPTRGCLLRAVVNSRSQLYEIELPSGALISGPSVSPTLSDVALDAGGALYGVSSSALYRIDYAAGTATRVATGGGSALEFGPDGELYAAMSERVYRYDLGAGDRAVVAMIGTPDRRLIASGDLVFRDGRMLLTADDWGGTATELLIEVDLATGTTRVIGDTGEECIWGMVLWEGTLYGMSCNERLFEIDPATGATSFVRTLEEEIWGATVR